MLGWTRVVIETQTQMETKLTLQLGWITQGPSCIHTLVQVPSPNPIVLLQPLLVCMPVQSANWKKKQELTWKEHSDNAKGTCDYAKGTCKIAQPVGKKANMEMKRSLDVKVKTKKSAASMETTTRKSAAFNSLKRSWKSGPNRCLPIETTWHSI